MTPEQILKTRKRHQFKKNLEGALLASAPLIGYFFFGVIPLIIAVIMSFHEVYGYSLEGMKYVGFYNFTTVLQDPKFWLSIRNTAIMALSMPVTIVLALLMAFLINKNYKGSKIFRAIYFIPFICSVVAVTYMWQWLFNTNYGVINQWLGRTGENAIDWLGTEKNFLISVIIMNIWSGTGFGIILYSASLTNVSRSLLEQSEVDGANAFQRFFHVTLPSISPTTFYLFTMGLIGSLQAFAVQNILGNNTTGPDDAGLTSVFYIYRNIFSYVNQMGMAAAASWLLSVVIAVVTAINFFVSRYWVNYD
jgi:multiple sugar transport system permease protein